MKIGTIKTNNFTIFAPLAGITNLPFRLLAKKNGCGCVYTEMISSEGLIRSSFKTTNLLTSSKKEKPLFVQIFGNNPTILAEAAEIVESLGADAIDINFGCSVRKIIKSGSGIALMKNKKKAKIILKKVREKIKIPLTIKIRTGWNPSGKDAIEISKIAEDCGVNAIAIHPRTAIQGFRGISNWSIIKKIKKNVQIPIIGNGDINSPYDAIKMKNQTGCDYVMIGRGAIKNPLIFKQIMELLDGKEIIPINEDNKSELMRKYLKLSIKYSNNLLFCKKMRNRLFEFVTGTWGSVKFKKSARFISSIDESKKMIISYKKFSSNKNKENF